MANNPTTAAHCLCLIHPVDPRGSQIGGIESHIRLLLQHAPANWRVLMVGVDGYGDCKIGELTTLDILGRRVEFLPVIRIPKMEIHQAATGLQKSLTARFGVGLLQKLLRIQRAIGPAPASIELQRFEFAAIPFLLRRPAIQVVHGEGSKRGTIDPLIGKYRFGHRTMLATALRLADAIVCDDPDIAAKIRRKLPAPSRVIESMPVPVDSAALLGQHFARHQRVAQSNTLTSHQLSIRRLTASLGVLFPWTVDVRYALSIKLRRALSMPVERDFQVVKVLKTRPGEVFCDIGCNRGQSIESLLLFNKSCQIIAFEPNPITFEKARTKYQGNSRIAIHNVGLSAERSRRTLFIPKYRATYFDELASFDCASARSWFSGDRLIGFDDRLVSLAEFSSEVTTLDDFALSPAFIKIDVQGYETKVLQGAWSTISRVKPVLLIENDEPSSAEAVSGLLRSIGYRPHRFDGEKLHRNEFGSPNTLYIVPELERGLDEVMT